ncbi:MULTISPECIES: PACE efflux transporter [Psychrobacter]|uniref:Putative membrane protein n=2 Tax=Psychrobacter TaxID=497 RepID=A0A2V1ZX04_PSYIM|nr:MULTISPECIES: PACE efflux transporter [Psychrobacter]MCG3809380.1 PACE efflux transporter [Psychrobacter sp. Ps4]MCG3873523.1 PACE efflux transporter [Psychrobacter sp. Ps7]PWK13217.1 putative membrane protein [Psychrobacter immobilis]WLG12647.1 PACE efflux transporter [Psychrobacter cibarius]GAF58699.1 putative membrane protein [Psychrobacter sp. JCM 18902]
MRTVKDRIRHTLGFEIIGLIIFVPLASWLFGFDIQSIGLIAVAASIIATLWNYFYNLLFDHSMLKLRGNVHKTVPLRMLHAFLFEGGLLLLFLPIIAWHLGISLWQAFLMDITMATFYLVHAFVYNWIYDNVFPIPANHLLSQRNDVVA